MLIDRWSVMQEDDERRRAAAKEKRRRRGSRTEEALLPPPLLLVVASSTSASSLSRTDALDDPRHEHLHALGSMSSRPPSPSRCVVGRIDRAMEGLDTKLASMRRSRGFALSVSFLRSATQQRSLIALSPRSLSLLLLRLSASVPPSRYSFSFSRCGSSRSCLRNQILIGLSLMLLETAGWTRFGLFLIEVPTSMLLMVSANGHHSTWHLSRAIINASSSFLIDMPTSMLLTPSTAHHSIGHQ